LIEARKKGEKKGTFYFLTPSSRHFVTRGEMAGAFLLQQRLYVLAALDDVKGKTSR